MLNTVLIISFYSIASAMIALIMNYTHFLNMLLALEMLNLGLFTMMAAIMPSIKYPITFMLYFLITIVCEAVLGLALLVLSSYIYSTDHLKNINTLVC